MIDTLVRAHITPNPDPNIIRQQYCEYMTRLVDENKVAGQAGLHPMDHQNFHTPTRPLAGTPLSDHSTDTLREMVLAKQLTPAHERADLLRQLAPAQLSFDCAIVGETPVAATIRQLEMQLQEARARVHTAWPPSAMTPLHARASSSNTTPQGAGSATAASVLTGVVSPGVDTTVAGFFKTMASEFVAALQSSDGTATAVASGARTTTSAADTPSHLIKPIFTDDAGAFGDLIFKMISWIPDPPQDLAQSTQIRILQAERLAIVTLVSADVTYHSCIINFEAHVRNQLDDAATFAVNGNGATLAQQVERTEQARLFVINWHKMQDHLRVGLEAMDCNEHQYRLPVKFCVQRALGVSIADSTLKAMKQHSKLHDWFLSLIHI